MKYLGAIYPKVPAVYPCNDGTFSTSGGRNACNRHGGRRSDMPVHTGAGGSRLLNIQDVPLSDIHIDRKLFQGRESEYSSRSVENIISDVAAGRFVWENLDPVTLWRDGSGKLFLLSGHSRFEAFKRLAAAGATIDGKGFTRIPAKIRSGSLDDARRLALESNTLSTKETPTERAVYYIRLRAGGMSEKDLRDAIRKNEDKSAGNIYAYTWLNPNGRTFQALKQLAAGTDSTATLLQSWARWIGTARQQFPFLSNEHETELFAWLADQKGYGTGTGQVSNERDFLEKVKYFIQKNSFMGKFDTAKPLNILNLLQKSPVEQQFDEQIRQQQKIVVDQEKKIKLLTKDLTDRKASRNDIARILEPEERYLRNARLELQRLLLKKTEVVEYAKNEQTLFGIGKIYDDIQIKPGSRVDQYWKKYLAINPQKVGVESYRDTYYRNANEAIKHFRLYSLEFGNWLNQQERAHFMYASLVTLRDMAQILGIPHAKMGIHGKLSLAFGSRGRGGRAAAFYQVRYVVINLTKTYGRGTLVHEYGHAIDFLSGAHSSPNSIRKTPDYDGKRPGTTAWNMEKVLDLVLWDSPGVPSSYQKWLQKSTFYYNMRAEIWARICETYFITKFKERGIFNTWGVPDTYRKDLPRPELVKRAEPYIKKIFHAATK